MEPIPLLRNLLRQASVLYDDVARSYITRYIKRRFRLNKDLDDKPRIFKLLKEGRRSLSVLTRANAGDHKPLQKVLEIGYGRVGRGKHEFLKPLLGPQPGGPPDPLVPDDPGTISIVMTDQLMALAKAQTGMTINKAEPQIPATNIWGRPLPKCREINIRRWHFANVIRRILPPITSDRFERLERLVRGEEEPLPPKRKIMPNALSTTVGERRQLTPRFKRRMWKKILAQSPVVNFDLNLHKWRVSWSDLVDGPPDKIGELADFEGFTRPKNTAKSTAKSKKQTPKEVLNGK